MHKINGAGATSDFRFQDNQAQGTRLPASYLNMLQDELTRLVTDPAGGATELDPANQSQILAAILTMISRATGVQDTGSRKGIYYSTLLAGNYAYVTFAEPFPAGTTVHVILTPINASGSARRDNWVQLFSWSETGFTVVCQGSRTGGDDTLDGFTWSAEAI